MASVPSNPDLLPGTTFPLNSTSTPAGIHGVCQHPSELTTFSGPQVNGEPTKVTLFSPQQLVGSPLLLSQRSLINVSFSGSHSKDRVLPAEIERLQNEHQFLDELGNAPGTFTYIVHRPDGRTVLATASSKRYSGEVAVIDAYDSTRIQTFKRKGQANADIQEWELNLMAVDVGIQKQGLAGYLMGLIEAEIKRRSQQSTDQPKKLKWLLTTIKELNERFYSKRGFVKDYETWHEPGYLGSETGFTVIHMSRNIGL